jgi:protein CMS1
MSYAADDLEDGLDYQVDSDVEAPPVEIKEDDSDDEPTKPSTTSDAPKKRRRKDDKLKEKKKLKLQMDIEQKKNISLQNSTDLAHHFSQILIKNNKESTQLDYFKKADFVDGSNYKEKRNLDNLKDFTDKYNKGLTIILALNRVRIGDLYKSLGPKSKAMKVGKGYDSTVRDDTKYIIGTVERISNLDLTNHEVKSIILDATFQDQKTNSVLDEPNLTTLLKKFEGTKIILY